MTMLRYNAGKAPIALIPTSFTRALLGVHTPRFILEVAKVLDFGAQKYSKHNWRKGGPWMDMISSAMRHYLWYRAGEELDSESGMHHLAHLGCNWAFLMEHVDQALGEDDRFSVQFLFPRPQAGGDWLDSAIVNLLRFQDGGDLADLKAGLVLLASYFELLVTDPEPPAGAARSTPHYDVTESIAA